MQPACPSCPPYQAFLDSVVAGVIPSMDAVAAVPNTIMALCLNNGEPWPTLGCCGGATCLPWPSGVALTLPAGRAASRACPPPRAGGLERVRRSRALRCFVPIFSSKQYVKALQGERSAGWPPLEGGLARCSVGFSLPCCSARQPGKALVEQQRCVPLLDWQFLLARRRWIWLRMFCPATAHEPSPPLLGPPTPPQASLLSC